MSTIKFHKYQATGNDFIMIDNRERIFPSNNIELVKKICDRKFGIGSDGLILIEPSDQSDFTMNFYNPDGSKSLCGNGSRCAVNFSKSLGIIEDETTFMAFDGIHHATIDGDIVNFEMHDVQNVTHMSDGMFLDTGSPHYTQFIAKVDGFDVVEEGRKIRYGGLFHKEGVNVNFIQIKNENEIYVRTYERGVENETLSCGTGVTASVISAGFKGVGNNVDIITLGGKLNVTYKKNDEGVFNNIVLSG
ncbi:MAG: diaminopimelate epimerase, partial [Cyclobacteriaceae bacterium]|nr:diaminopimelate epimerase [Cyclobacteriaceae bacterium]